MYVCDIRWLVLTTGEQLRVDWGDEFALQGARVGAFGVLHPYALGFDPAQHPLQVAVAQQVACIKLTAEGNAISVRSPIALLGSGNVLKNSIWITARHHNTLAASQIYLNTVMPTGM